MSSASSSPESHQIATDFKYANTLYRDNLSYMLIFYQRFRLPCLPPNRNPVWKYTTLCHKYLGYMPSFRVVCIPSGGSDNSSFPFLIETSNHVELICLLLKCVTHPFDSPCHYQHPQLEPFQSNHLKGASSLSSATDLRSMCFVLASSLCSRLPGDMYQRSLHHYSMLHMIWIQSCFLLTPLP